MSESSANGMARWRHGGFVPGALLLFGALVAGCLILAPAAWWFGGPQSGKEVGAAAAVCLLSGLLALAVTSLQVLRRQPLVAMLFGMSIRLLPPLAICLALAVREDGGAYFGFICYLLVFYLISLAVETYLAVKQIQADG